MRRAAYGLILSIGLARLALGLWLGFRPFDDTYITFRYAVNLASGFGFVYNIGELVLGTTSPLRAMMLAALRLAQVPIELGSLAVSLTLDVATAILLFRLLASLGYGVDVCLGAASSSSAGWTTFHWRARGWKRPASCSSRQWQSGPSSRAGLHLRPCPPRWRV